MTGPPLAVLLDGDGAGRVEAAFVEEADREGHPTRLSHSASAPSATARTRDEPVSFGPSGQVKVGGVSRHLLANMAV
jgi:hypothetical protein